jgi:energy coupling factor transporter S component ThiW
MIENNKLLKFIFMAMMVAIGVVISPILRVEGMCPMAHLINITCAVMLGPYYAFACALIIGIIRMIVMGIPPLAITGAVFGAFLSGMLYRLSRGKLIFAFLGEVVGTGIIGAIVSYPVMTFIWGKNNLTWFFYVPSFIAGTLIGGSIAFILLKQLQKSNMLRRFQQALGSNTYDSKDYIVNDAIGIACIGILGYLISLILVKYLVNNPSTFIINLKYMVFGAFVLMALIYYFIKSYKVKKKNEA